MSSKKPNEKGKIKMKKFFNWPYIFTGVFKIIIMFAVSIFIILMIKWSLGNSNQAVEYRRQEIQNENN